MDNIRSRKYFCSGNRKYITYTECVSVADGINHSVISGLPSPTLIFNII
jgi:hypothetical protein